MRQDDLRETLQTTEKHILAGEVHLTRQRVLIQRMARDGHSTQQARELLLVLEQSQAMHLAERARLLMELNESGTEVEVGGAREQRDRSP